MADHKEEFEAANERARHRRSRTPTVTAARYDKRIGRLVIDLSSGLSITFRPQDAQGFERAKPAQLAKIEISPSGLGLHFPAIDADIYLPGLLEGFLGSRRWMAAQLGKAGGSVTSRAKAAAVRANGRLGGRPKKPRVEDVVV
ncbi:MAG: DUF2442 domain-containing protein [Steroidobacteraceae bacterium]